MLLILGGMQLWMICWFPFFYFSFFFPHLFHFCGRSIVVPRKARKVLESGAQLQSLTVVDHPPRVRHCAWFFTYITFNPYNSPCSYYYPCFRCEKWNLRMIRNLAKSKTRLYSVCFNLQPLQFYSDFLIRCLTLGKIFNLFEAQLLHL